MARPERFTVKQVCEACEGTGGILALVAKKLVCDRVTVWRYAKRYASVRQALEQADEAMTDMAEGKSLTLIQEGIWPAIRYRLSTKGKRRGYTEARGLDITTKGEKVETNIIILPAKEDD